jgi:arsenate reductase
MMQVTIYHNPSCSKSRETLELLYNKGINPIIIEYLKTPPDRKQLQKILRLLAMPPRDLMRKNEAVYTETGLQDDTLDDNRLMAAMIEHPILIERPIVLANGKAVIGRPPGKVLEII